MLSWRCGIDLRTAQEKLRVAHALERDQTSGGYVATNPAGSAFRGTPPAPHGDHDTLRRANADAGHTIDPTTAIPKWGGESLDLGWAVTSLYYSNHPDALTSLAAAAEQVRASRASLAACGLDNG